MTRTALAVAPEPQPEPIEKLATRWAQIKADIDQLKAEEDQIKTQLATLGIGNHEAGPYTIQIQAPRRTLNKTRFMKAFPINEYPTMYSMQLDTTAIKNQIAPAVLDTYKDAAAAPVIVLK